MKVNLIKILIIFIFLTISIGFIACNSSTDPNYKDLDFPTEGEVSYRYDVEPFLRVRCAYAGCHSTTHKAGGMDLTNWFSLMSIPGFINTDKVESSLFLQVVNGDNPHLINLMLIKVRQNQIDGVKRWLEQGALNN